MDEKELKELQDPNNWEFDETPPEAPPRRGRAVVSVAFNAEDFDRVSRHARASGLRLSEFIREAALDRTTAPGARAEFEITSGGLGGILFARRIAAITINALTLNSEEVRRPERLDESKYFMLA